MICFQRNPNGVTFDLWIMGANGSNPLETTFGRGGHGAEWSPDSRRLVSVSEMPDDAEPPSSTWPGPQKRPKDRFHWQRPALDGALRHPETAKHGLLPSFNSHESGGMHD